MGKKRLSRKKINPQTPVFTGIKYTDEFNMQLFIYNQNELVENENYYEKDFEGFFKAVINTNVTLIKLSSKYLTVKCD